VTKSLPNANTISRVKIQPTEWKKIFADYISDKKLISIIYAELTNQNHNEIAVLTQ
jgi:hypothetical protein